MAGQDAEIALDPGTTTISTGSDSNNRSGETSSNWI